MNIHARYGPLARYLSELSDDSRALSFKEIEAIVGRSLPPSASGVHGRQWWANTTTHSQGQAWIEAGWRVEDVDLEARRVRFRRTGRKAKAIAPQEGQIGSDDLLVRRAQLSPGARRLIEDYSDACGGDEAKAVARIVEEAALERRRKLIDWFAARDRSAGAGSADMIREDRDAG